MNNYCSKRNPAGGYFFFFFRIFFRIGRWRQDCRLSAGEQAVHREHTRFSSIRRRAVPKGGPRRRATPSLENNANLRRFTISHHIIWKSMFKWSSLSEKNRHDIYRHHQGSQRPSLPFPGGPVFFSLSEPSSGILQGKQTP